MAANRIKGITIELSGDTTKLQNALKDADTQIRRTQGYLKDIDRLLKLDPGNVELLTQKEKYLNHEIEATQSRLKELKSVSKDSLSPEQWDAVQREIVETEQKLNGLEKEYKDFGSVAKQQLKAVGEQLGTVGKKMTEVGGSLTAKFTLPITGAFVASGKAASDYEENLNKIDTAFGNSAQGVKDWANTAIGQFGLSKVAASEAVSGFGALGKGIGLSEENAASMSITLAGLSSDLSSYFNVSTSDSAKALEGIFTGESEALKRFGVVMTDTNLSKFAEDQGKVWKEMDQTEKTMLRYNYVLAQTKDAQGDYARTSDGTANSVRTLQASLSDAGVAIGTQLLPTITPLVQKVTDLVGGFASLDDNAQKVITTTGLVVAAIGPLTTGVGNLVSAIGLIVANPLIAGGVLLGGLLAAAIYDAYKNTETWADGSRTMSEELDTLNGRIDANMSALEKARTARQDNVKAVQAEWSHTKKLKTELNNLVDQNGKVKKGYEGRVAFITGELSRALDIEIEYNGDIIKDYQNISAEIDNMIATRRRAAMLNAFEEEYAAAIRGVSDAQKNLSDAMEHGQQVTASYNAQRRKVRDLEMAINAVSKDGVDIQTALNNLGSTGREIWAKYYEEGDTGYDLTLKLKAAWEDEADTLDSLEDEYVQSTQAIADADTAYQEYQHTIKNYEGAQEASIKGDTEAVEGYMKRLQEGYQGTANEYEKSLQKMAIDADREYLEIKKKVESGEQGVTKAQEAEALQRKLKAEKDLADYRNTITHGFEQLPSEAAAAMNKKASLVNSAGKTLGANAVSGMAVDLAQADAYGSAYSGHYGSGIVNNAQAGYNGARYLVGKANEGAADNSGATEAGSNWGAGYYNGMSSWERHIRQKAWDIAMGAVQEANYAQISRSPSRAMMKTGRYFGEGYVIGMEQEESAVEKAAAGLAETAMGATADPSANFGGVYTSSGAGRSASNVDNRSVTYGATNIQIYAQPGMDVNQLADAVQNRLALLQRQREAAFA